MKALICARQLFDGKTSRFLDGAAIVVNNGVIECVARPQDLPPLPSDIQRFDFPHGTLLPGLIDAHVHLTMDGCADPMTNTLSDSDALAACRAVQCAAQQIKAGVTTVRDCGSQNFIAVELAKAVKSGIIQKAPRILACGPVICITGGHGSFIGIEADGPAHVQQAVRGILKKGADFVKVIASGGVLTKGTSAGAPQMTYEELLAAAQEAKRAGVRITTHAHAGDSIRWALRAGFDCIEHATYIDSEIIELFQATGAFYIPTVVASVCQMEHLDTIPPHVAEKIQKHVEFEYKNLRTMLSLGVPIAGATDAGTPFNPHGNLPRQLNLLHQYGLSKQEALRAGTYGSAQALGLEDQTGTLEVGKSADILVVQGNVLEDLNCLYNVQGVWREGMRLI